MRILIKRSDFISERCDIRVGEAALELEGERGGLRMPFSEVNDFCVLQDQKGRRYFTMICGGGMYEGKVLDAGDLEPFLAALKDKLHGIINIEVRKC